MSISASRDNFLPLFFLACTSDLFFQRCQTVWDKKCPLGRRSLLAFFLARYRMFNLCLKKRLFLHCRCQSKPFFFHKIFLLLSMFNFGKSKHNFVYLKMTLNSVHSKPSFPAQFGQNLGRPSSKSRHDTNRISISEGWHLLVHFPKTRKTCSFSKESGLGTITRELSEKESCLVGLTIQQGPLF